MKYKEVNFYKYSISLPRANCFNILTILYQFFSYTLYICRFFKVVIMLYIILIPVFSHLTHH